MLYLVDTLMLLRTRDKGVVIEEKEFKEKYHKKENKYGIQIRH